MPPPPHLRCTWSGILGTGAVAEIFSMSLNVGATGSSFPTRDSLPPLATLLKDVWVQRLAPIVSTAASLRRVRIAAVTDDGLVNREASGAFVQGDWNGVANGAGTGAPPPPQIALVCTLQSAAPGPTGRGRFFLPLPTFGTLGPDLLLDVAIADARALSFEAFVTDVNSRMATGNLGRVVVASGGSVTQSIAPALRPVTSVKCGRVLDTMRSRRNNLLEQYSVRPIA